MKKKIAIVALILMCALFVVGLVLIFSSSSMGEAAGNTFIQSQHGTYFNDQVNRIIESTTTSYQMGGLVLSLIGGFGLLLNGYVLLKEM